MKAYFQIAECSLSSAKIIKIQGIKVILMNFNIDNHNYSCLAKASFTKFVNNEFKYYLCNIKPL